MRQFHLDGLAWSCMQKTNAYCLLPRPADPWLPNSLDTARRSWLSKAKYDAVDVPCSCLQGLVGEVLHTSCLDFTLLRMHQLW
jgi:hypothetical protein